jgi:hypothetical protein
MVWIQEIFERKVCRYDSRKTFCIIHSQCRITLFFSLLQRVLNIFYFRTVILCLQLQPTTTIAQYPSKQVATEREHVHSIHLYDGQLRW